MQTFIVRLWVSGDARAGAAAGETELRGVVDDVAGGSSSRFVGGEELLALLRGALARSDGHAGAVAGAASRSSGDGDATAPRS